MLQRRHARFGDLSRYRRNRRWTFLSAKAQRTKECGGRTFGSIIPGAAADQRARLGKAFPRHDALGDSKDPATAQRGRPEGRSRASLGSIRRKTYSALPNNRRSGRELFRGMTRLIGQVLLNLRL